MALFQGTIDVSNVKMTLGAEMTELTSPANRQRIAIAGASLSGRPTVLTSAASESWASWLQYVIRDAVEAAVPSTRPEVVWYFYSNWDRCLHYLSSNIDRGVTRSRGRPRQVTHAAPDPVRCLYHPLRDIWPRTDLDHTFNKAFSLATGLGADEELHLIPPAFQQFCTSDLPGIIATSSDYYRELLRFTSGAISAAQFDTLEPLKALRQYQRDDAIKGCAKFALRIMPQPGDLALGGYALSKGNFFRASVEGILQCLRELKAELEPFYPHADDFRSKYLALRFYLEEIAYDWTLAASYYPFYLFTLPLHAQQDEASVERAPLLVSVTLRVKKRSLDLDFERALDDARQLLSREIYHDLLALYYRVYRRLVEELTVTSHPGDSLAPSQAIAMIIATVLPVEAVYVEVSPATSLFGVEWKNEAFLSINDKSQITSAFATPLQDRAVDLSVDAPGDLTLHVRAKMQDTSCCPVEQFGLACHLLSIIYAQLTQDAPKRRPRGDKKRTSKRKPHIGKKKASK